MVSERTGLDYLAENLPGSEEAVYLVLSWEFRDVFILGAYPCLKEAEEAVDKAIARGEFPPGMDRFLEVCRIPLREWKAGSATLIGNWERPVVWDSTYTGQPFCYIREKRRQASGNEGEMRQ